MTKKNRPTEEEKNEDQRPKGKKQKEGVAKAESKGKHSGNVSKHREEPGRSHFGGSPAKGSGNEAATKHRKKKPEERKNIRT